LHLSGLEDLTEQGFEEMATVQEAIVQEVEAELVLEHPDVSQSESRAEGAKRP
jgi:hypothetical protein